MRTWTSMISKTGIIWDKQQCTQRQFHCQTTTGISKFLHPETDELPIISKFVTWD